MPEEVKKEEEVEVRILDRSVMTIYPTLTEEKEVISITFTTPKIPPTTIRIPKEEYSKEREDEEIAKAIREYKEVRPEVKKVKI